MGYVAVWWGIFKSYMLTLWRNLGLDLISKKSVLTFLLTVTVCIENITALYVHL